MKKIYMYKLEIAKDSKYNVMKIYGIDVVANGEKEWVLKSIYQNKEFRIL